jgi:multiple sugar transport system permease protein
LLVAFLLRMIFEFRSFDNVYVMTSGGPANATMVASMCTYPAPTGSVDLAACRS